MHKKAIHGFLVRIFASTLVLVGAVLLSAGLVGDAEAQVQTTDDFAGITLEFAGETPDYHSSDLCARLGGEIVQVTVGVLPVCTEIDTDDTFCIAGSREVFPCRGLYRRVLLCNQYNRPAKNPFICEAECSSGKFACGGECWSGEIGAAGRIPYVAPGHVGDVFQAAVTRTSPATVTSGEGRFSMSSSAFTVNATNGTVGVSAALSAGSEYAAVVSANLVCGGLSETFADDMWAFTITALAAQPVTTIYLEGGEGAGAGTVTISGIGQLNFEDPFPNFARKVGKTSGEILYVPRPTIGAEDTLIMEVTSPEVAGKITLTVVVKFRHPFDSDLGANHCRVPADYHELRRAACLNVAVDDYCRTLDAPLFNALGYPDGISTDSAFCRALRGGAEVNLWRTGPGLPRGESPLGVAAAENRVDIGRILTLSGALLDGPADALYPPLHEAAQYGAVEFGAWLLTSGANINRQAVADVMGSSISLLISPMHILAFRREIDRGDSAGFAKLLLDNSVDPNETAHYRYVFFGGITTTTSSSIRYINLLTAPLNVRQGFAPDHRPLTVLLDAGLDAHHENEGILPLTRAIQYNYPLVASILLKGGTGGKGKADPNRLNSHDQTAPLFHATSPEAVSLLAGAGADLNISVNIGGTVQTALDSMVSDFVQSVTVFYQNTILDFEPQLLDGLEDQFTTLKRLGDLGGDCLAAPANSSRKALCTVVDGSTTGGADIGETASCDDLWTLNLGENELYMSSCHLECSTAGQSSEEWHCAELGDIYDDSGALDSSLVDAARSECETRAASSESGLSCQ